MSEALRVYAALSDMRDDLNVQLYGDAARNLDIDDVPATLNACAARLRRLAIEVRRLRARVERREQTNAAQTIDAIAREFRIKYR